MVGHGESTAGSYLADPTSPIPSHCASIVVTSTVRVKTNSDLVSDQYLNLFNRSELSSPSGAVSFPVVHVLM